ncbi:uncharacterized protein [Miscanthus floridulus]|uniref:uncharacterized protein isoform X1 n=1 Tax=Miscanthus floridulus TaxID=154761 RepID=UPI0034598F1E
MASTAIAGGGQVLNVSNPEVVRVRQLIGGTAEYSSDGWRRCWEEGVTPWDLGQPTPAVVDLVNSGTLPGGDRDGRATTVLVPGCGAGHDVVALSGAGRFVVGLDISEAAIHKARQRAAAAAADGNSFDFVAADFFTWEPPDKFDIIFDYTYILLCFRAVDEASMGQENCRPAQTRRRAYYPHVPGGRTGSWATIQHSSGRVRCCYLSFFFLNRCCYLSSVYILILLYFMAANSKVIYNTTKLFLCVCMHAATRKVMNPLGFSHEQHPRQRGGSPITKGNGKNGKVEEDGKPNQPEFCRRDADRLAHNIKRFL